LSDAPKPDLIYDIGMSEGNDTDYYLRKGFRVVGVEADPRLFEHLTTRFGFEIMAGRLIVLNRAASDQSGKEISFWHNEFYQGLSSTIRNEHPSLSDRQVEYRVRTIGWSELVTLAGVPHYCKIDIEGGEGPFLRGLQRSGQRPTFISAEVHSFEPVQIIRDIGYSRFKFVNQKLLGDLVGLLPNPPLEGVHVAEPNWIHASGPFGRELPDQWLDFEQAREVFGMISRLRTMSAILGPCWFDCHAWWEG
jgi:FkbM family methyltransferase